MFARLILLSGAWLFAGIPAIDVALAQSDPPPRARGITVYDEDFFGAYNVLTARDMLERVPGMAPVLASLFQQGPERERRGLRSDTDQILINGRRSTSKASDVADYLDRIPARQVARIEVVSGNVKELDASVSGRVVNIVLKSDAEGVGSGAYNYGVVNFMSGPMAPSGQLSYSYQRDSLSYTLGIETRARGQYQAVDDLITAPAGPPIGRFYESRDRKRQQYTARGRLSYGFENGASVQVSGFLDHTPFDDADFSEFFMIDPALGLPGERKQSSIQTLTDGRDTKYEISSDVTVPVGSESRFLGFAVYSDSLIATQSEIFDRLRDPTKVAAGDSRRDNTISRIARGTLQSNIAPAQEIEIGIEGAVTTLDKDLDFFQVAGGQRVDIPVFNSNTRIKENRAEVFSTYSWKPSSKFEIEPGLAAEFSRLKQDGVDVRSSRSFHYAKPSLNIWYNVKPSTRLYFAFLRDVGQLRFTDFAATFIREDNEVVAGNPNLVPQKAWAFDVGAEHRLDDGRGLLELRAFYRRVNDVNDEVPLGATFSGPGNLGSGDHYGARFDWSFKLAAWKLWDAVFDGTILVQDSKVRDAFTGKSRRFGGQPTHELRVNYRHDIPSWDLNFGIEYIKNGAVLESDFTRFDRRHTDGDLRISVERKIGWGLSARILLGNVLYSDVKRDRAVFAGSQASSIVARNERRLEHNKMFTALRIRGDF